jgi:hypothetical protein
MDRPLDDWTDGKAHAEWLELRQKTTQAGFTIPDHVRNAAVNRLYKIITDDNPHPIAIQAILALVKLANSTATATTISARILETHTKTLPPLATDPEAVAMREMSNLIFESKN